MSNVTQIHNPKKGETSFMRCQCIPDAEPFVVVIEEERPIITALRCPECGQELPVVNGVVEVVSGGPA